MIAKKKEKKAYQKNFINNSFKDLIVRNSLKIGKLSALENCKIQGKAIIRDFCSFKKCTLGHFFACENFCSATDVKFGSFVSIGERVTVNAGIHPKNYLTTHLFPFNTKTWGLKMVRKPFPLKWRKVINVGSDVWIGSNSILLTGVTIGHGAIIGANSFVNKSIPPYAICGGSPIRILNYRFDQHIVSELLATKWWLKPIDRLIDLPFHNISACLELLKLS